MVDITTIESDAEQAIAIAETVLPNLFNLPSWLLPALQAAAKAVATVQAASPGTSAPTAAAAVVDHLTPGAPAAPALN